jgi:hypothetical protein
LSVVAVGAARTELERQPASTAVIHLVGAIAKKLVMIS